MYQIEANVAADIVARLTAEGAANAYRGRAERADDGSGIAVDVQVTPGLQGGQVMVGMFRVDILLQCYSYRDDDTDLSTLDGLLQTARAAMYRDNILALLDGLSSTNTYRGLEDGNTVDDSTDTQRVKTLAFTAVIFPSTTTTTTTTTTTA